MATHKALSTTLWRFARRQPLGAAGALLILAFIICGLFAPWVSPYDPFDTNFSAVLEGPSRAHWFGTDSFGRDVLSRIVYGSRSALALGVTASLLGAAIGGLIGVMAAYYGGKFDTLTQRLIDIILSIPVIVLALVLAAVLGKHEIGALDLNLVLAIAIPNAPRAARIIRSAALSICHMPYIEAAKTAGFTDMRIILGHIAPNLAAPALVLVTAFVAQAILMESSLSFLGVGIVEPAPSWGLMLSGVAVSLFAEAPWTVIFPGLAISITVFAFCLLGDALRDELDPKSRS
jgi:peptide/nickel transport system permease protein